MKKTTATKDTECFQWDCRKEIKAGEVCYQWEQNKTDENGNDKVFCEECKLPNK